MERTSRRDWNGTSHRQVRVYRSSTGVLAMARQRKEKSNRTATLMGLGIVLFTCVATFLGVSKALAGWRSSPTDPKSRNVAQATTPAAAPVVNFHADGRPVNILLLGSDQREGDGSFRTDVIVLVSIDTKNVTASAVSFPRDLWVEPPTLYPMKINMIQGIGGFDSMTKMFETNFGVRPDFYVQTNFSGFVNLIDSIGGIDVNIGEELTDSCDLPQAQGGICSVGPGVLPMDGATALWYARSRQSSSDYARLRRAQEVIQAVFERLMNLGALSQLPKFYKEFSRDVETNLTVFDITKLAPVAVRLFQEQDRIHGFVIDENQATPSWSWDGMWILLPDNEAVRSLLEEAGIR